MKIRVFNDFYDFANDTNVLVISDITDVRESMAGGWTLIGKLQTIYLPATVVLDIINEEE